MFPLVLASSDLVPAFKFLPSLFSLILIRIAINARTLARLFWPLCLINDAFVYHLFDFQFHDLFALFPLHFLLSSTNFRSLTSRSLFEQINTIFIHLHFSPFDAVFFLTVSTLYAGWLTVVKFFARLRMKALYSHQPLPTSALSPCHDFIFCLSDLYSFSFWLTIFRANFIPQFHCSRTQICSKDINFCINYLFNLNFIIIFNWVYLISIKIIFV